MSITVPNSVGDFKAALGQAILDHIIQEFGSVGVKIPNGSLAHVPAFGHIAVADQWCDEHRQALQNLAQVARLAERQDDPFDSLVLYVRNDIFGIKHFLNNVCPKYVADVFRAGVLLEEQELLDFLRLLQEIAV